MSFDEFMNAETNENAFEELSDVEKYNIPTNLEITEPSKDGEQVEEVKVVSASEASKTFEEVIVPYFENCLNFEDHDLLIKIRRVFDKMNIENKKQSSLLDFFTKEFLYLYQT